MARIVINNLIKEENLANQCKPLDKLTFAEIQCIIRSSHLINSNHSLLFDIITLACFIGPCVNEYAQTTQDKVDYHVYPSGTQVIKAFTANDFFFHDKNGNMLAQINKASFDSAVLVEITWRIQKNQQNGQKIKPSADTKNTVICPSMGHCGWLCEPVILANWILCHWPVTEQRRHHCSTSPVPRLPHSSVKQSRRFNLPPWPMTSRNTLPIPSVFGNVSFLMKRASHLHSSKNGSTGWETPSRCTSATQKPSKTSILVLSTWHSPTSRPSSTCLRKMLYARQPQ
jgi:hypothetical protein